MSVIWLQSEEMKEVIKDEYIAWLAQYFVMKRVSIEPNFHQLYSNFLDGLKIAKLTKFVQREVFRNITVCPIFSYLCFSSFQLKCFQLE